MHNMKRKISAALASLALLFAAMIAGAAPAQADYGTYVEFYSYSGTVSPNAHIRVWSMNGVENRINFAETQRNAQKVCPPDHDHYLSYASPRSSHTLAKGQCTAVSLIGTYKFSLRN